MDFSDIPFVLAQEGAAPSPGAGPGGQNQGQSQGQGGTTAPPSGPAGTQPSQQQNQGPFGSWIWILLLLLVGMWIFMITSQRKEKKKKQQMQQSLQKGAKVQTIGGVLGTIVEVRDEEVIVKVDENANTRMRFARSAIQTINEPEKQAEEKKTG